MRTRSMSAALVGVVLLALGVAAEARASDLPALAGPTHTPQASDPIATTAHGIAGPFASPAVTAGPLLANGNRVACASDIRGAYAGEFSPPIQPTAKLVLSIAKVGRYALVGWEYGEEGGMSLFERRAGAWCRAMSGGGAFTEKDIVGVAGVDRLTAHALFTAHVNRSVARAR